MPDHAARSLNTSIDVYDVGANEIVPFRPNIPTPNNARWIVRNPTGTNGDSLAREVVGAGPAPSQNALARNCNDYR